MNKLITWKEIVVTIVAVGIGLVLLTNVDCLGLGSDETTVATGSDPDRIAIEAYHQGGSVKWLVPTFKDIEQCTDKELLDMAVFCVLGKSANDPDDFIRFGNKLMPERFKVVITERGQQ